jgi:hypothetical protein
MTPNYLQPDQFDNFSRALVCLLVTLREIQRPLRSSKTELLELIPVKTSLNYFGKRKSVVSATAVDAPRKRCPGDATAGRSNTGQE